jgi:alpha-N-acetylgalactosaminidase
MLRSLCVLTLASACCGMDNGVGQTPMMGWMAWIRFRCNINCELDPDNCVSERLIKSIADEMVSGGWKDAGYEYVSIGTHPHTSNRARLSLMRCW